MWVVLFVYVECVDEVVNEDDGCGLDYVVCVEGSGGNLSLVSSLLSLSRCVWLWLSNLCMSLLSDIW